VGKYRLSGTYLQDVVILIFSLIITCCMGNFFWPIVITGVVLLIVVISVIVGAVTGRVHIKESKTLSRIMKLDRVSLTLCRGCKHLKNRKTKTTGSIYFCEQGLARPAKSSTIGSTIAVQEDIYPCNTSKKPGSTVVMRS